MINPNGDDFPKHDPIADATTPAQPQFSTGAVPRYETSATPAPARTPGSGIDWQQTREKATEIAQRTEGYLRENPIPTIIGALAVGLAIGLAIRYSSEDEPVVKAKPLSNVDLSFLTMPFLWPFFRQVKDRYEDTAEVVKDRVTEGVGRLKEVDVDEYVKPLRKKVRSWRS